MEPLVVARAEISRMLGVGKARATQLIRDPDFPRPVAELAVGKLFLYTDVEAYAASIGRKVIPLED